MCHVYPKNHGALPGPRLQGDCWRNATSVAPGELQKYLCQGAHAAGEKSLVHQKLLFIIGRLEVTIALAGGGKHLAGFGCIHTASAHGVSLGLETGGPRLKLQQGMC